MSRRNQTAPLQHALLVAGVSSFLAILVECDVLDDQSSFIALTVLLLTYLWIEVRHLRRIHPYRWLVNPIVSCSVVTFVMGFGLTNAPFLFPAANVEMLAMVPEVTPAMVKLMWLVLLGAVSMWLGYWSPLAGYLSRPSAIEVFQTRLMPRASALRPLALPALVSVAVGARLIQIKLGIFGYSGNLDTALELSGFTQLLGFASVLGWLALALATFQFYVPETRQRASKWFYALVVEEVLFGVLSGFKSAVVFPFLIVGLCRYLRSSQVSRHWVVVSFVALMAAYAIIEPFRAERNDDQAYSGTSVSSIARTMLGATADSTQGDSEITSFFVAVAGRSNLSYIGSFGIAFADDNPTLPEGSPDFLADVLWAPIYAWIPRILWEGKPISDVGRWYNQVVMGNSHFSSTAMGPFTYLYLAGGTIAVSVGFFFLGIVQRSLFFLLEPGISVAGSVVFLAALNVVGVADSNFSGLISALSRELPLIMLAQFIIFKSNDRLRQNSTNSIAAPGANGPTSLELQ